MSIHDRAERLRGSLSPSRGATPPEERRKRPAEIERGPVPR